MHIRLLTLSVVAALAAVIHIPASCLAADFSARMISEAGGSETTSRLYYSKDKFRTEPEDADEGGISIVRLDKKVVWVIMPSEKAYMEMPLTSQYTRHMGNSDNVVSRKDLGPDKVAGRPARKELVTIKDEDGDTSKMYEWTDKELKIPSRAEDYDGEWSYRYEDVKVGKQDPKLFELPKGYTKMSMDYSRPGYPEPPDYPEPYVPDAPEPPYPSVPSIPTPW